VPFKAKVLRTARLQGTLQTGDRFAVLVFNGVLQRLHHITAKHNKNCDYRSVISAIRINLLVAFFSAWLSNGFGRRFGGSLGGRSRGSRGNRIAGLTTISAISLRPPVRCCTHLMPVGKKFMRYQC